MVQNGDATLALLQLPMDEASLEGSRSQRGHFAIQCAGSEFWKMKKELPTLLAKYSEPASQGIEEEVCCSYVALGNLGCGACVALRHRAWDRTMRFN